MDKYITVKDFPTLEVNDKGSIRDKETLQVLHVCYASQYPTISVAGGNANVHVIMANAFVNKPETEELLEVNHIDGNKLNFTISNLEWLTRSDNVIHAYTTGLRSDNRTTLVKDLTTGKIESFYSLNECARSFNVNQEKISRYVNNREDYPYQLRYDIIFEGEEWRNLTKDDIGRLRPGQSIEVVGYVEDRKELHIFTSLQNAASYTGTSAYILGNRLVRDGKFTVKGFTFWLLDGLNLKTLKRNAVVIVTHKKIKPNPPKRLPKPIIVFNEVSGDSVPYLSVELFASSVNAKKNTVQKAMYVNNGKWKHYLIEYVVPPLLEECEILS